MDSLNTRPSLSEERHELQDKEGFKLASSQLLISYALCMSYTVIDRISIAVKRHHDHGNSYKGKHLFVVVYSSEVQSIIIVVGYGNMQAGMLQ